MEVLDVHLIVSQFHLVNSRIMRDTRERRRESRERQREVSKQCDDILTKDFSLQKVEKINFRWLSHTFCFFFKFFDSFKHVYNKFL